MELRADTSAEDGRVAIRRDCDNKILVIMAILTKMSKHVAVGWISSSQQAQACLTNNLKLTRWL